MDIQQDELNSILQDYEIIPEYTEALSEKALKVHTSKGNYVLKRLAKPSNHQFVQSFLTLNQHRYTSYVPIVNNKYQQSLSKLGNDYYYIMPWLPNDYNEELDARHQYLFKEIAALHHRTEVVRQLQAQEAENHYTKMIKKWEEDKEFYERFVEHCEQKLYLSPFELQAVTYFIEVSRAIEFSSKKLKEWSDSMENKEKSRIVLTHGKISAHHFLYDKDGTGYLSNFEHAKYASPIDDLLLFMYRTSKTFPTQCQDCVNWFYTYQNSYPFKEDEMLLFLSYLAYPQRICQLIKQCVKNPSKYSELEKNKRLIRAYWHFKNIEYLVMKISEVEEKKKLEAAEA